MIVVAGGSGLRFGAPKQFAELAGRAVVHHALEVACACGDDVVLVLPAEHVGAYAGPGWRAVAGGATRAASVRAGLAAIRSDAQLVVVHDAARPLASPSLFAAVIDAVMAGADGAVPGVPLADTVKQVQGGDVVGTLDRTTLVAVQTPQAFRAEVLRRAHAGEPEATDDAGLVEAIGGRVAVVAGEARNVKLTTPADLLLAQALLRGDPTTAGA